MRENNCMTRPEKIQWLKRAGELRKVVRSRFNDLEELKGSYLRSAKYEKHYTHRKKWDLSDYYIKYVDRENQYADALAEWLRVWSEIFNAIVYQDNLVTGSIMLIDRFIDGMKIEDIAVKYGCCERHVIRQINQAIDSLVIDRNLTAKSCTE